MAGRSVHVLVGVGLDRARTRRSSAAASSLASSRRMAATPFATSTATGFRACANWPPTKAGATAMANAVVKVLRALFEWATPKHMPVNIARDVELISRDERRGLPFLDRGGAGPVRGATIPSAPASASPTRSCCGPASVAATPSSSASGPCSSTGAWRSGRAKPATRSRSRSCPSWPRRSPPVQWARTDWIVGDKGEPLTPEAFIGGSGEVCDEAGLQECSAHGLRKAAARRFALAGATVDELKAWFGWTENKTPGIYTRDADNSQLADNAARRMRAA